MGYLQPWMWWALPAVLLPLLIHLLNRLRYKTVHWAAMHFLLKANRAATRRAKIRQYLLLACRMLVVLFLIWAMARPLVGGWLGATAGGAPETVLILLDRSASMEAFGGQPESKRLHALALLGQAAKLSAGSRFILIENVLCQPLEIADASSLGTLQMARPTDTATDLPSMLRAALDYLVKNKPGSAEIWIASDLQASNWRPESSEWGDLSARFGGLSQQVHLRVLDLSSPASRNISVAMKSVELRVRDPKNGKAKLNLNLHLKSGAEGMGTVPLFVTRDGTKNQTDIKINALDQRQNLPFDLPKAESGWGKIELPADDNPADNTAYFVYAPPVPVRAAIVGESPAALRFAVGPDKTRADRKVDLVANAAAAVNWKETTFIAWTGTVPDEKTGKALQAWVESGGVLLCFPSGTETGPAGITWAGLENATPDRPFRVTAWDELDGPLARTDNGTPLPLARLDIQRRQIPTVGSLSHTYATFADGRPFLVGSKLGAGQLFACAVMPEVQWGSLGEGFVLLPMVQRLVTLGSARLSAPVLATAGEWHPADPQEIWTAVDKDRDWRWNAGIYQSGDRTIALNRPEIEDQTETVEKARISELLKGVKLTVMAGAMELKADRLQSEIWPAMLMATMLFMCAEMLLATSKALLPTRAAARRAEPLVGGAIR
ncbi:MAG: Conserved hypothetical rane protein [Chthoniobacteraceae bacterium]|nr:Conserved hypothetical rane protein [Chthoniobacteraceae bacterium]